MQEVDLLIRTKLRPPFSRPSLVPRERLKARVMEGLQGPLTLIVAPAGFGKTTLVTASLADCRMPLAWLSLDKDDNRAGRFLPYLIAALQGADPQVGHQAAQLMAGMHPAPDSTVLASLVNDLDAAVEDLVLVLDDYQFIRSQEVHEQVGFLLEHCPTRLHLVIASRSDPPLPLARWRARGQMVELRASDLRFTISESTQFLNEVMDLCLDPDSVSRLEERTEGWVAGLQMAALSLRDRVDQQGFIERFSGTNRYILDYLLEEILASQPLEIQHFLLITSTMERLTAPLCNALLEVDEFSPTFLLASLQTCQQIIEYLQRENLFLISLDEGGIWFRYHHLFADLLRARLHQTQPDVAPRLHIGAAIWFEQNGFILEAIQHLCAANEMDRAADLIEHYGPLRWAESDPLIVQMADSLPHEILMAHPKLCLYQIWLLVCEGKIGKALPLLKELDALLAMSGLPPGQEWMQIITTLALAFLTPVAEAHKIRPLPDDRALDQIPADEPFLCDIADILYAMTLARHGEIDRAEAVSSKWVRRNKNSRGTLAIPALVAFLTRIYFVQGRLQAATSLCREFLQRVEESGNDLAYNVGNVKIVLGEVHYERHDLEGAEKQIRDGLHANEPWRNLLTDAFGHIALTRLLQAKGDYAEALQVAEKFETRMQEPFQPIEFKEELRTLKVRVQLVSGDIQTASEWADRVQMSEDYSLHESFYQLTLARIRLVQCRFADVEKLLFGKSPLTRAGNRITRQIESKLLLAAAFAGQERLAEAFELVEASLALAEPEGFIQIFLDLGEPARDLLAAYLRSEFQGHSLYARKLLEMFSSSVPLNSLPSNPAGLVAPLSGREQEVLQLMALGRTNQEIAQQLIVATGTVKAHAASIYRKLNAANRTEAVAHARQLNLLA